MWLGLFDTLVLIEKAEYENNYIYSYTLSMWWKNNRNHLENEKIPLSCHHHCIAIAKDTTKMRTRTQDKKYACTVSHKIASQDRLLILASNCKGYYLNTSKNVYRAKISFSHSARIVVGTDNRLKNALCIVFWLESDVIQNIEESAFNA